MKHIVTKGDPSPKTPKDIKDGYCVEANTSDLVDLLQANIPNNYAKVTLHKWGWNNKWDIKGEYVIFDFDPKENDIGDKLDEIVVALNKVVGLDRDHLTIIFTGRGYHVLIKTIYDINLKFLKDTKKSYTEICKKLGKELEGVEVDPIFPRWNVKTRIPGRYNEKNNKEVKLIQVAKNSYAKDFLTIRTPEENQQALQQNLITDSGRVLSECRFISTAKARILNYESWMAMLSNLVRLPNGEALAHEYSKVDTRYTEQETSAKILEANNLDQPYSCSTIGELWDGCKECTHYKKIKSPTILGLERQSNLLRQQDNTFKLDIEKCTDALADEKLMVFDPSNKASSVDRLGYFRFYEKLGHWKESGLLEARSAVDQMIRLDSSLQYDVGQTRKIIDSWYLKYNKKLDVSDINTVGFLNFPNGILNTRTGDFFQDDNMVFDYVLDYDYDPDAKATFYPQLMAQWQENVEYQIEALERYVGLSFMGLATDTEKFVIITGITRNGKSMFFSVLREVFSKGLISSLPLAHTSNPTTNFHLIGKSLNICDESRRDDNHDDNNKKSHAVEVDWDALKQISSGQDIICNPKHKQPFTFCNKAGIIVSANKIPEKIPNDPAIRARLLHLRFPNSFSVESGKRVPSHIILEKIKEERAGILNYFLDKGRKCVQEGMDLKIDDRIIESVREITNHESLIDIYFNEAMKLGDDSDKSTWVKAKEIYKHFKLWYEDSGHNIHNIISSAKFSRKLPKHFMNTDKYESHVASVNNGKLYNVVLSEIEGSF